jgi:demethylmenaquinone methyltransferase / 2-methoxy-6-polyprenyl-1,4-benzoquinol methylase
MSVEKITPYKDSSQEKKLQVATMFNNIAWRYDFLNHFLSLGIDRYWRRKAIARLKKIKPQIILDIATGTADLALEAVKLDPVKIFGIDISEDMLKIGRMKIKNKKLQDKIELLEGDSEKLIFTDNKFDAVTVAFGVRNFEDLKKGLMEMNRVLKPGGMTVILEFSRPTNKIFRWVYDFYSSKITPKIGQMISKDKAAYSYLHESVKAFPYGNEFCSILKESGFKDIHYKTLTFGIATIYTASK